MSELSDAISEMRNMRQAYDQVGAAAEAYNAGKAQLVENINAKGIPASATETLPELAGKVAQIAQQPIVINDGDLAHMYSNQLFGGETNTTSVLWNLYDILAQMKNQFINAPYSSGGNIHKYGALMVCEYYKGYDSLQLKGADAYFTCDGDFYPYANSLHTWHDSDNGKVNRWVCFLYVQAGAGTFTVGPNDSAISPRSIYVGGHIGKIEYLANGRLTELVCGVEDTDVVDRYIGDYTQTFSRTAIIRDVKAVRSLHMENGGVVIVKGLGNITYSGNYGNDPVTTKGLYANCTDLFIEAEKITCSGYSARFVMYTAASLRRFTFIGELSLSTDYGAFIMQVNTNDKGLLEYVDVPGYKSGNLIGSNFLVNLNYLRVGEVNANFNMRAWNPNYLSDAAKVAKVIDNIKNGILARVSDRTGLSQLTFTIGLSFYNAIANENIEWQGETMTLADAFLTKNWRIAGA